MYYYEKGDFMTYVTHSPEETEHLGASLAGKLGEGRGFAFVALYGEMGAGKTAFVRGMASVLSPGSRVKSPTYTIVNEYRRGKAPLFHFDLCRLSSPEELDSFGFSEYVGSGHCVCEWADILGDFIPEGAVIVKITGSGTRREIEISGADIVGDIFADGADCAENADNAENTDNADGAENV